MRTIEEIQSAKILASYDLEKGGRAKAIAGFQSRAIASGEGSRGGHVIGHTKSGKPVYKTTNGDVKKYSSQDHSDAAQIHSGEMSNHSDALSRTSTPMHYQYHHALYQHHKEMVNDHRHSAESLAKQEHESSLSGDEKKIVADQKKKQIDHHIKQRDIHNELHNHIVAKYGVGGASEAASYHREQAEHHHREVDRLDPSPKNPHDK
jgi:hypothetical protein